MISHSTIQPLASNSEDSLVAVTEAQSPAEVQAICPYCLQPICTDQVRLWDDREYHQACVDQVSPTLRRSLAEYQELSDTVTISDVRWSRYVVTMWRFFLSVSLVVVGIPLSVLSVLGAVPPIAIPAVFAILGLFAFVYLCLQSWLGIRTLREVLPRTVSIGPGGLVIRIADDEPWSVPLGSIAWYIGNTSYDPLCLFTSLREPVVLRVGESHIAVGLDGRLRENWRAFLELSRIRQSPPASMGRVAVCMFAGLVIGAVLGFAVGQWLAALTEDWVWKVRIGLLGLTDGVLLAALYASYAKDRYAVEQEGVGAIALTSAICSSAAGIIFSLDCGWRVSAACGITNTLAFGTVLFAYALWSRIARGDPIDSDERVAAKTKEGHTMRLD